MAIVSYHCFNMHGGEKLQIYRLLVRPICLFHIAELINCMDVSVQVPRGKGEHPPDINTERELLRSHYVAGRKHSRTRWSELFNPRFA